MKSDRYFYSTAAAVILVIMFGGFMPFFLSGHGQNGRVIAPNIFPVVLVHGLGITAWYVLSLVQSLLITVKNRRLHMKLGWSSVAVALVVATSGIMVAVRSARNAQSEGFVFFGMIYSDFLLVMFAEIAVFTLCVVTGLLMRQRPERHRALMLLASLSLLLGATTRMPVLATLFGGDASRVAFFRPVFVLAAIFVLVHSVMIRGLDRWFATGYALLVITYVGAEQLSRTDAWRHLAAGLLKS